MAERAWKGLNACSGQPENAARTLSNWIFCSLFTRSIKIIPNSNWLRDGAIKDFFKGYKSQRGYKIRKSNANTSAGDFKKKDFTVQTETAHQ